MSSKKRITVVIAAVLTGYSIAAMMSCTHPAPNTPTPAVSFSTDIVPILTASCALNSSCHEGANSTNLQTNFDPDSAYYTLQKKELINTSNPAASLFYAEVEENQMPLAPYAPLSASQKSMILTWIEQGAKDN